MRRPWWLLLALGAGAMALSQGDSDGHVLILMGDTDGYLSPCGCTSPMSGSIVRRAAAVRLLGGKEGTVLDNGSFVEGTGRQDYLKAEAMAEALRLMHADAASLTLPESQMGRGLVQSLQNLSAELLVQSNLEPYADHGISAFKKSGPFLIGAVSHEAPRIAASLGTESRPSDEAVRDLIEEAMGLGLAPILMLSSGREEAERLARAFPELKLILFRSTGKPLDEPVRVGSTQLVSPGEHGIFVIRMAYQDGEFKGYRPIELGPEYEDDSAVSRVYRRYLSQVEKEDLFGKLPRQPGPKLVGSAACGKCHAKAAAAWKRSAHAHALRTLINDGHGRDPDCVRCHVVGADSSAGFMSVKATPQLASVGCESCHGAGAAHARTPKKAKLGRAGAKSCLPCHTMANSPDFDFARYWPKVAH